MSNRASSSRATTKTVHTHDNRWARARQTHIIQGHMICQFTASQHHSITASQHHSITASQHHSITASQHHSITTSQAVYPRSVSVVSTAGYNCLHPGEIVIVCELVSGTVALAAWESKTLAFFRRPKPCLCVFIHVVGFVLCALGPVSLHCIHFTTNMVAQFETQLKYDVDPSVWTCIPQDIFMHSVHVGRELWQFPAARNPTFPCSPVLRALSLVRNVVSSAIAFSSQ